MSNAFHRPGDKIVAENGDTAWIIHITASSGDGEEPCTIGIASNGLWFADVSGEIQWASTLKVLLVDLLDSPNLTPGVLSAMFHAGWLFPEELLIRRAATLVGLDKPAPPSNG